jgi:hypothetical protein
LDILPGGSPSPLPLTCQSLRYLIPIDKLSSRYRFNTSRSRSNLLAQLAMIFSLGDSFLALSVRMSGFVRLQLDMSAQAGSAAATAAKSFADLSRSMADIAENLGGLLFGLGSLLFFYLFLKSTYIPRVVAALGVFASVIWDSLVFCEPDIPGTPRPVPENVFPADAPG